MTGVLNILFVIGFAGYSFADFTPFRKCYEKFRSGAGPVQYSLPASVQWKSPYTQEIFSHVYQKLPLLEGRGLSDQEIKNHILHLERLLRLIDSSSSQDVFNRLELMNSRLSSALEAFPMIVSFIRSGKTSDYPSLSVSRILNLLLSTFSRHIEAYLTHPQPSQIDWPRINLILKSISDFRDEPGVFALYKIKRAVRQKYSLEEYINCE